jgi:curli biogenesis system outer membrane secretion channel CsgG
MNWLPLIKTIEKSENTQGMAPDERRSGVPTLVFLNIRANGISESDKEFIITGITDSLRTSKRVQVVEREILDKLLEELKLSSSHLAEPAKVLEVGKILAAQIISTGSISRDGSDWQVSLRFIDTETTSIQAAVTESLETKDKAEVVAVLSKEILNRVKLDK